MGPADPSNFVVGSVMESKMLMGCAAYEEPFHGYHSTSQPPANMTHPAAYSPQLQSQWNGMMETMHPTPQHLPFEFGPGFLRNQHGHEILPHQMSVTWGQRHANVPFAGTNSLPSQLLDHNAQVVYRPRASLGTSVIRPLVATHRTDHCFQR